MHIPADTSRAADRLEVLRYGGKIRRFTNLPRRREEWELYHATYYNWTPIPKNIIARGDPRDSVALQSLSEKDWLAFDTYGEHKDTYFPLRSKLLFH